MTHQEKDQLIKELNQKLKKLESQLSEKDNIIEELNTQLSEKEQEVKSNFLIVSHKGKKYEIKAKKINLPGVGIKTDKEIQENEELVNHLLKIKSSILTELK